MGWAIGDFNGRDIGYGVPAICDFPRCGEKIDRGLSYVCGGEPYGGERGCGLFFCGQHLHSGRRIDDPQMCSRCANNRPPWDPTPDVPEWIYHKLTDESWATWRDQNPDKVNEIRARIENLPNYEIFGPRIEVLEGLLAKALSFEISTDVDGFTNIRIDRVRQSDGSNQWAIRKRSRCFGRDGDWHFEPTPSSRTNEFIKLTRFDSLTEAIKFAETVLRDVKP